MFARPGAFASAFVCSSVSDWFDTSSLSCVSHALAWQLSGRRRSRTMPGGRLLGDWTPQLALKRGLATDCSSRGKYDSDDEAVKGESLGEDHHKNKRDQDISLGVSTDTGVTDDTNAESGGERGETAAQA